MELASDWPVAFRASADPAAGDPGDRCESCLSMRRVSRKCLVQLSSVGARRWSAGLCTRILPSSRSIPPRTLYYKVLHVNSFLVRSHSLGPPWLRGHFHQPSPTGPLSGGSRFRRYTEGPNPEPLPLTADRPILESRHVPQHQNAFPFRSAGDGRRGARRFPAVRPSRPRRRAVWPRRSRLRQS